ncbi:PREDICTED: disease [Prunus dulcis]|uniref:PREDICTED: disease n=1 Tax=Prunus dulcis TaxID=3755 RepID=A0A5E4FNT5_PRUDU|nr:PREDICTED: disease [Prunus dulcis]
MAEGFILSASAEVMEDVSYRCLRELVGRCMVQVGKHGLSKKIKTCHLHDFMRDLCMLKAKEGNFVHIINYSVASETKETPNSRVRRLAIYLDIMVDTYGSGKDENYGHVRSLLYFVPRFSNLDAKRTFEGMRVIKRTFKDMRVTEFREFKLPDEIGNLVHLRFLSVKDSDINAVPSSIANLSLSVDNGLIPGLFSGFRGLPIPWNIVLSYPNIYKLPQRGDITELPEDLLCLTNLTKLTLSRTGNLKDDHIKVLEKLPSLRMLFLCNWDFYHPNTFPGPLVCSEGGFSFLEFLSLAGLMKLKEWKVEQGGMPSLSLCRLHIRGCFDLEAVPDGLQYITTLKELTIDFMRPEFCSRLGEGGEDFYKIQHVQSIIMTNIWRH